MPSPPPTNISNTVLEALNQLQSAQKNLASIDLNLVDEIQSLLEEKASLQADVASLRAEKETLSKEVNTLKKGEDSKGEASPEDDDGGMDSSGNDKPPDRFLCPMTLEVMKVPMQHRETKHNYERKAIYEWIYFGKATCPLTRKKLHPDDFVENIKLRDEIKIWKTQHEVDDSDDDSDDDLDASDIIPALTAEEDIEQQTRLMENKIKRNGSHNELMGIRSRVLKQRDTRVQRRLSNPDLF